MSKLNNINVLIVGGYMDDEKKLTASEVLFENVYQISEDMIQATYKLVEEISKFETAFRNMSSKLGSLNDNLKAHIVNKKWVKAADKRKCKTKIEQSKEIMLICQDYADSCINTSNDLIAITERFEANKKVRNIIKNLSDKIEKEAKRLEEEGNTGTTGNKPPEG